MIEVKNLSKKYGDYYAIQDVSFNIEDGKIYGFLGPNGAGKSTTMNIITGCLASTEGEVLINGYDIFEEPEEAKSQVGYLPEIPPLYLDMTPREYLWFVARAKKVPSSEIYQQINYVMQVTQIEDVEDRLIKHLSKGYRQRVGIAQALLGGPAIIILDEPTVGLDPQQIIEMRELIRDLGKNHTVILSSHILSEVQAVCDRILIISKGKIVANDTPEGLEKKFEGSNRTELTVRATESEVKEALLDLIDEIEDMSYELIDAARGIADVVIDSGGRDLSEEIFFGFARIGRPIRRMAVTKLSLEDIFMKLTSDPEDSEYGTILSSKNTDTEED